MDGEIHSLRRRDFVRMKTEICLGKIMKIELNIARKQNSASSQQTHLATGYTSCLEKPRTHKLHHNSSCLPSNPTNANHQASQHHSSGVRTQLNISIKSFAHSTTSTPLLNTSFFPKQFPSLYNSINCSIKLRSWLFYTTSASALNRTIVQGTER